MGKHVFSAIVDQIHFLFVSRFCLFCAFTRPRYQVSVYRTIGPLVSKSNSSLYCLQSCSNAFQIDRLDSSIIAKKPKYPFSLFSALFEENNQNFVKNEGINSILSIETEPIKIKTGKTTRYILIY